MAQISAVAAGGLHSALIRGGMVYTWGCNEGGALGVNLPGDLKTKPWVATAGCECCPPGACAHARTRTLVQVNDECSNS